MYRGPLVMVLGGGLAACAPVEPAAIPAPAQNGRAEQAGQAGQAAAGSVTGALAEVNAFRARAGVAVLRQSAVLSRVAAGHAADLAATGRFSHEGRDGSSVGDRARRAGYRYCFIAENLARGPGSLDEVISGWRASPGHRANMLNVEADEMALVRQGDLWVMVLGRGGC